MDAVAPDAKDVLLFTWDGGGNIPPLLALGRKLLSRGHRVRMVGTASIAERASAAGIDFAPFVHQPSWSPEPGVSIEDVMPKVALHLMGPELGDELLAAVEALAPDALVIDCMAGGALSMAEHLAIPAAVLLHLRARFYFGVPCSDATASIRAEHGRRRQSLGLAPLSAENWWGELWQRAGDVYIASTPELEGPGMPLPETFTYVGSLLESEPGPLPSDIANLVERQDGPLVVTSLSTTYMHQEQQLQTALAAIEGKRGVITVGDGLDPSTLDSVDGRVAVTRWLPHETLLPHADVVVTHGGHGTVMAALAAGVPLVCLPMGRDQNGNADEVERVGAGVRVDAAADAGELRAAIDLVLTDPSYAASARLLATSMARLGGADRLAAEVEGLAATTTPMKATPSRR